MKAIGWMMSAAVIGSAAVSGCASSAGDDPAKGQMAEMPASGDAAADISYGGIPRNAMRVSSGRGILRFRVQKPGTLWVGDDDARANLFEQGVVLDDVLEVDPYSDQILLNHRVVSPQFLDNTHRHSVFYLDARKKPRNAGE
jgi:hypothetical protein